MKKIIELGNKITVEFENDEYKIISANGNIIKLDSEGEILSCENFVGQKEAEKRKNYLKRFIKIGEEEYALIHTWMQSISKVNMTEKQQKFLLDLEKALGEMKYEFYVAIVFTCREKIDLISSYKEKLPHYNLEKANSDEVAIWTAYEIARESWTFEEALDDNKYLLIEKLYVLKKS